jgi:hypothetical protein
MKPEYLELDSLAMTLGLDLGSADQALKAVLCKVIGEQDKCVSPSPIFSAYVWSAF